MRLSRLALGPMVVIAGLACTGVATAQTSGGKPIVQTTASIKSMKPLITVSLETVDARSRDSVAKIMRQPTIVARGAPEEFAEGIYRWLLDHPDRASLAWRRLG